MRMLIISHTQDIDRYKVMQVANSIGKTGMVVLGSNLGDLVAIPESFYFKTSLNDNTNVTFSQVIAEIPTERCKFKRRKYRSPDRGKYTKAKFRDGTYC